MNLQHIISQMTWSYSRIRCFEDCPYKFFLTYVKCCEEEKRFFASYGSFVHAILASYLNGELCKAELAQFYLMHFKEEVLGKAPSGKVFARYFDDGYRYFSDCEFNTEGILAVEEFRGFKIGEHSFVGVMDYVRQNKDGSLVLGDHKSKDLKPRTHKRKPTKSDKELDTYLEQLYLYCMPFKERFGKFPDFLEFNCFRTGTVITEPFSIETYKRVIEKFSAEPASIALNEHWNPNIEYFKCKYLCGKSNSCEYYQLNEG